MKISKHIYALAIAGACASGACGQGYTLTFNIQEVGSDVVVSVGAGSAINLSNWQFSSTTSDYGTIDPQIGYFSAGSRLTSGNTWMDYYVYPGASIDSTTIFGSGSSVNSNSQSGASVGIKINTAGDTYLLVPAGYTSGSPLPTSTSTFSGQTLSSIGLFLGNYTYAVGSDTIHINIGSASPVPEASGSVAGIGLAMAGLYQLRRRKAAVGKLSVERKRITTNPLH